MGIRYGSQPIPQIPYIPPTTISQKDIEPLMKQLEDLNNTLKAFSPVYKIGEEQGWKYEEANKIVTFFKTTTLLTTPNTHEITIPHPFRLDRIDMAFLTAGTASSNAKTVSIRIYAGVSPGTYTELYLTLADINTSIIVQAGLEYAYKAGTKISLVFSSFTDNDTAEISITITKVI